MNSVTFKQKQKFPCGVCHKWVNSNHRAIQCGICHLWIHYRCNGLTLDEYQRLQLNMEVWFCKKCISDIFPFTSLDEFEFDTLLHSDRPSDIELRPPLDIMSKISDLNNLDNSGIESNIPNPINSVYYYPSDFQKLNLSSSSTYFSLFHVNLNSLDAHLDDLQTTLASLKFPFQISGISETRENYSTGFKMNNNLNGYTLFSQPSRSAAGGVAIYASKSLNAFKRTDLSTTDDEFETVWVEINNTKAKNILCCCAYRHPSFNPVRFKEHFESILSQLTRENKNIFIMGDFNINLLTCESHPESNDFILMLNSFFLLPYILQPTRITERSATLLDNIFANTYSMNAISGNLVSKISDHLPQLLIVDNIKVNYNILNYYKNDYTKFDEDKFINEFTVINWENISNTNLDANTKFNIFYDQISQFINSHHSRPQSSSLLRMTDGEKSSGEPWTKLFHYLLFVETKKARLIGQSTTR